jgi:hypothetical protein
MPLLAHFFNCIPVISTEAHQQPVAPVCSAIINLQGTNNLDYPNNTPTFNESPNLITLDSPAPESNIKFLMPPVPCTANNNDDNNKAGNNELRDQGIGRQRLLSQMSRSEEVFTDFVKEAQQSSSVMTAEESFSQDTASGIGGHMSLPRNKNKIAKNGGRRPLSALTLPECLLNPSASIGNFKLLNNQTSVDSP